MILGDLFFHEVFETSVPENMYNDTLHTNIINAKAIFQSVLDKSNKFSNLR